MKNLFFWGLILFGVYYFVIRESDAERLVREQREVAELVEQERRAEEERQEARRRAEAEAARREQKRIEAEREAEVRRKEQEERDRYLNNRLANGSTPYRYCYGGNAGCEGGNCSTITVRTPENSDVLVTIKRGEKVVRHAYIRAGSSYSFQVPEGTYQPFFYYGRGWHPSKPMKTAPCGELKGGFISGETVGKDDPQYLSSNILEYQLILQSNGNFSQRPSSTTEAL